MSVGIEMTESRAKETEPRGRLDQGPSSLPMAWIEGARRGNPKEQYMMQKRMLKGQESQGARKSKNCERIEAAKDRRVFAWMLGGVAI